MAKRAARTGAEPKPARSRTRAPRNGSEGELLMPIPNEEEIRIRAYQLYLERGAAHGNDFDDWVTAEKELKVAHN